MAIPGLRKIDHWGVTVPNIAEAVSFFETHFNFKLVYSFGPFSAEDDWMKTQLNVDPRAEIKQIAMMNAGNINLELFEYSDNIPRSTRQPNNADVGGHHLGFYVDDIEAAVTYLKEQGLQVLGDIVPMEGTPNGGMSWVYFLTPWGMQMELVSYPSGLEYEKSTSKRLFDPRG